MKVKFVYESDYFGRMEGEDDDGQLWALLDLQANLWSGFFDFEVIFHNNRWYVLKDDILLPMLKIHP